MVKDKKIRVWYATYRQHCEHRGVVPFSLKVWLLMESDKALPTARRKAIARALAFYR